MSNRFIPLQGGDIGQLVAGINRNFQKLDREAVTKSIRGPNGSTAVIFGMRPNKTFGLDFRNSKNNLGLALGQTEKGVEILLCNPDGIPWRYIGNHPVDGRPGDWSSPDGVDVLELLRQEA